MHKTALVLASVLLSAAACSTRDERPAADQAPGPTPTVQRTPIGDLPEPDIDAVLAHTKTLSSDEFQGRSPGTKGEELTVAYITDQFRKLGRPPAEALVRKEIGNPWVDDAIKAVTAAERDLAKF